jgi:hypothetical protein
MKSNEIKSLRIVCLILFGLVFYLGTSLYFENSRYESLEETTQIEIKKLKDRKSELEIESEAYYLRLEELDMEVKYWGILYEQMKSKYPKQAKEFEKNIIL